MDERDDVEERLRTLGRAPVPPALVQRHLLAMSEVGADPTPRWRFGWKAVAGAAIVGFLAGSAGLASAGALPDPAQDVAHDVLASVGVDVPRSAEGCPEGTAFRNHGEYVASVEAAGGDVQAAAHSDCGMPVHANRGQGSGASDGTPRPDADGDPCTGPPPWAGAHVSQAERDLMREQRQQQCGGEPEVESDDADEVEEPEVEEPEVEDEPTTTTPVAETTATTAADDATTTTGG